MRCGRIRVGRSGTWPTTRTSSGTSWRCPRVRSSWRCGDGADQRDDAGGSARAGAKTARPVREVRLRFGGVRRADRARRGGVLAAAPGSAVITVRSAGDRTSALTAGTGGIREGKGRLDNMSKGLDNYLRSEKEDLAAAQKMVAEARARMKAAREKVKAEREEQRRLGTPRRRVLQIVRFVHKQYKESGGKVNLWADVLGALNSGAFYQKLTSMAFRFEASKPKEKKAKEL